MLAIGSICSCCPLSVSFYALRYCILLVSHANRCTLPYVIQLMQSSGVWLINKWHHVLERIRNIMLCSASNAASWNWYTNHIPTTACNVAVILVRATGGQKLLRCSFTRSALVAPLHSIKCNKLVQLNCSKLEILFASSSLQPWTVGNPQLIDL